jgi:phage FluMu protein Com
MAQVLTCRVCKKTWQRTAKRGRLPSICPDCKGDDSLVLTKPVSTDPPKLNGKERVDRLELLLRANNVHIQQHTKDD